MVIIAIALCFGVFVLRVSVIEAVSVGLVFERGKKAFEREVCVCVCVCRYERNEPEVYVCTYVRRILELTAQLASTSASQGVENSRYLSTWREG